MLMIAAFIAACTPAIEKDAAAIKSAEDELYSSEGGAIDRNNILILVDQYVAYANNYPEDSMAVENLFKGAELCLTIGEGQRSIDLYDRVMVEYPDFHKVAESMFLKGYVYENYLGDLNTAKAIYTEFLETYPDNEFADDAEISIRNLGKSPEELIKEFEQSAAEPDTE